MSDSTKRGIRIVDILLTLAVVLVFAVIVGLLLQGFLAVD